MYDEEALILVVIVALLITVVVQTLYLLTLSRTIESIRPEFRKVEPGQAWLGFIPIFHLIWPFIINKRVAESIKADMEDRGIDEAGDYGKQIGTIYPAVRIGGNIPLIGILCTLAYLVLFIMWWVKLGNFRNKLQAAGNNGGSSSRHELLDN